LGSFEDLLRSRDSREYCGSGADLQHGAEEYGRRRKESRCEDDVDGAGMWDGAVYRCGCAAEDFEPSGVQEAQVDVVWDPPWGPQMITPDGRKKLGMD